MLQLNPTNQPFENLQRFLDRIANPNQIDVKPIVRAIAMGIQQNYINESNGDGQKWAPLQPKTQKIRAYLGYNPRHPILTRTGAGMRSFFGGSDHVERIETSSSGWRLVVGSVDQETIDNFTGDPKANRPPRPMTKLSDKAKSEVSDSIRGMIKTIRASEMHG